MGVGVEFYHLSNQPPRSEITWAESLQGTMEALAVNNRCSGRTQSERWCSESREQERVHRTGTESHGGALMGM